MQESYKTENIFTVFHILIYLMLSFMEEFSLVALNISELKLKTLKTGLSFIVLTSLIFLSVEIIYTQTLIKYISNISHLEYVHFSA